MSSPLVAIVGAPNVGKSTLFNRLIGRRHALVTAEPGMTRDRQYAVVRDARHAFRVVDTGGLTPGMDAPFASGIERQAQAALAEASVVLFVVDARAGATALDQDLASMLRRTGLPLLLLANKVDSDSVEASVHELHQLRLGAPLAVSAEHGRGIAELIEAVDRLLDEAGPIEESDSDEEGIVRVALVGRPNVGKSSILNRLVGEERMLVSEVPGTTRDAVDTLLAIGERRYRIVDTAGIRRSARVWEKAEYFSIDRSRKSIERCDVAVLVLDATQELGAQDAHIAGAIVEAYRPMVVAVNKWDLVASREEAVRAWQDRIERTFRFVRGVPLVFVSAASGQRVSKILDLVDAVHAASGIRVPTAELNRWLHDQAAGDPASPPPRSSFRLFYATQTGIHPPRFALFCNDPSLAHSSLRRHLVAGLRERFGFGQIPIRLDLRARRPARAP